MRQRRWTDQEILDALKYWAERHGRPPRFGDWQYADEEGLRPTSMTVWARVGSWTDALILAGLEPNVPKELYKSARFSRAEARRLRRQGLSDVAIADRFGVTGGAISKAIGSKPRPPRAPRNAVEWRVAREAALKRALEKES